MMGWSIDVVGGQPPSGQQHLVVYSHFVTEHLGFVRMYKLPGLARCELERGLRRVLGAFGDLDSDGVADLLAEVAADGMPKLEALSGATLKSLRRMDMPASAQLIGADFDGDGLSEYLRAPAEHDTSLHVLSTKSGKAVFDVKLNGKKNIDRDYFNFATSDINGDGRRDLIFNSTDAANHKGRIDIVSGMDGSLLRRLELDDYSEHADEDWARYEFLHCPSPTPGGTLMVARNPIPSMLLRAYSLADGTCLWERANVVERYEMSLAIGPDLNADGFAEIVSGCVMWLGYGAQYGRDGKVYILSGKDGEVLRVIEEKQFEEISLRRYQNTRR
jgi:hypothetical protein